MKRALIVGTINYYPPPDGWEHLHVDASGRGIWDAQRGGPRPIDIQADMRALPVADGSVDRIQCWHALEHVNQQGGRDALAEFHRVLKPGGVLDMRVPNIEWCIARASENLDDALRVIYGDQTPMADGHLNAHLWAYSPASLAAELSAAGFEPGPLLPGREPDEIFYEAVKA